MTTLSDPHVQSIYCIIFAFKRYIEQKSTINSPIVFWKPGKDLLPVPAPQRPSPASGGSRSCSRRRRRSPSSKGCIKFPFTFSPHEILPNSHNILKKIILLPLSPVFNAIFLPTAILFPFPFHNLIFFPNRLDRLPPAPGGRGTYTPLLRRRHHQVHLRRSQARLRLALQPVRFGFTLNKYRVPLIDCITSD